MKFILPILFMITLETSAQTHKAIDFESTSIDGKAFKLSDFKGRKIFLSFFRNGACALCNLRVHELAQHQNSFDSAGIKIIAVFESSVEDMRPYVGKQNVAFTLLCDPTGKLYNLYGVKTSPDLVNAVISTGHAEKRIEAAANAGFKLTPQEGSNFFRIPAEVLIDENFNIVKIHHCDELTDHLPIDEVLKF
jgi:peroxiredoxin Q/BCP